MNDKLKAYLSSIINHYKNKGNNSLLEDAKDTIQNEYKINILKYYYFYLYYSDQVEESKESLTLLDQLFY